MAELTTEIQSDKRLGYSAIFGIFVFAGIVAMFAAPGDLLGAWGFALAMIAASLAIVVLHLL